jgi:hypothetical protein
MFMDLFQPSKICVTTSGFKSLCDLGEYYATEFAVVAGIIFPSSQI